MIEVGPIPSLLFHVNPPSCSLFTPCNLLFLHHFTKILSSHMLFYLPLTSFCLLTNQIITNVTELTTVTPHFTSILSSLSLFSPFRVIFMPFLSKRDVSLIELVETDTVTKMPVALLLLLALSNAIGILGEEGNGQCNNNPSLHPRPHSVSILKFGAVGDGKTINTINFQNAIFYLKSFADKGGAKLYVPPGRWLTGSFNLTSHLTVFLEKGAVILGSQDPSHWEIVEPLPSYGRGIELPGKRYRSLINGYYLQDVVVTGDNGTIDGQGSVWWDWFSSHSLNFSRPHLVEFIDSEYIVVSNLTFLNPPAYSIHPVYCSNVLVQNISISSPSESPDTIGIVPDSSSNMCIEDSSIAMGYDAISLKSGWDEYGIAYGRPTSDLHIRRVHLQSSSGSCIAFGSEMSGGISNVQVEEVHLKNSFSGIEFRTTKGRGGYISGIIISAVEMENIKTAFGAIGDSGTHPDESFDPNAIPAIGQITLQDVLGTNITVAGNFSGIQESPFSSICLFNITLMSSAANSWTCSNVFGFSESVYPEPCPELETSTSSSTCYDSSGKSAASR